MLYRVRLSSKRYKMNTIEEIENLAIQCTKIDYSNPESVKEHNNAVDKLRELISNLNDDASIMKLLNNKNTCSCVAFQSLEQPEKLSKEIYEKAIDILREISCKNSIESMAAEMRLEELNVKSKQSNQDRSLSLAGTPQSGAPYLSRYFASDF